MSAEALTVFLCFAPGHTQIEASVSIVIGFIEIPLHISGIGEIKSVQTYAEGSIMLADDLGITYSNNTVSVNIGSFLVDIN